MRRSNQDGEWTFTGENRAQAPVRFLIFILSRSRRVVNATYFYEAICLFSCKTHKIGLLIGTVKGERVCPSIYINVSKRKIRQLFPNVYKKFTKRAKKGSGGRLFAGGEQGKQGGSGKKDAENPLYGTISFFVFPFTLYNERGGDFSTCF